MNNRKLIVKTVYGLIAVVVLVLVGILIYQQGRLKQISNSSQPTPSTENVSDPGIRYGDERPSANTAAAKIDSLKGRLEASEKELEMARADLSNEISDQEEIMRRPNMQLMGTTYSDLYAKLGLSEEQREAFNKLLVEEFEQVGEYAEVARDNSLPEEQRYAIFLERLENLHARLDNKMRDLIGSDNFEVYDFYRNKKLERQEVTFFAKSLDVDDELSDGQKQDLIDAMYNARKEVEAKYGIDFTNMKSAPGETDKEKLIEQINLTFERYAASADAILSDSQMQKFQEILKTRNNVKGPTYNYGRMGLWMLPNDSFR